ncbi:unnamed protein product [Amoebophrya sp. A120]|nr:unnamed protein product [Amoebophrya sp. A120]|eukprot:GSA120T00025012001.1
MASASASSTFFQKLEARIAAVDSLLCVGLDPHVGELGDDPSAEKAYEFCVNLIDNTSHVACCYKPNAAFFEQFGSKGWEQLEKVAEKINQLQIPIIFDCKRGDIGSTSAAYAKGNFLVGEALTISPYLGGDGVAPFTDSREKSAFVLCKTSNPGSDDLQTLEVEITIGAGPEGPQSGSIPLYMQVARLCAEKWGKEFGNIGVVVGATDVDALAKIRKNYPSLWFLSPGIGAQGGPLKEALEAGLNRNGTGMIIPISRGISKASDQKAAAEDFRDQINKIRRDKAN